ncbi:MAG: UDP-glucose 4-epimerase GalE, partial [Verrucomicrobia bacterium]|nr:UDP-glucose 4-epimerase GalE [Verrucomicrobiota bacterium]
RAELGWKPKYETLDSIIATALRWHTTHPRGFATQ